MLSKNNIWKFRVLGGDGKHVDTGDGATAITVRGPGTKASLLEAAAILLNSKRADAMNAGLEDPGYRIDEKSIEPLGHTDGDVGKWRIAGGQPLELPTDSVVRAQDRALLAEKLGIDEDDVPQPGRKAK